MINNHVLIKLCQIKTHWGYWGQKEYTWLSIRKLKNNRPIICNYDKLRDVRNVLYPHSPGKCWLIHFMAKAQLASRGVTCNHANDAQVKLRPATNERWKRQRPSISRASEPFCSTKVNEYRDPSTCSTLAVGSVGLYFWFLVCFCVVVFVSNVGIIIKCNFEEVVERKVLSEKGLPFDRLICLF